MSGSMTIETPLRALVGRGSTGAAAVFNPLSDAMDTTQIKGVLFGWWLDSASVEVRPAVQFSNDGANWTEDAIPFGPAASGSEGWTITSAYQDIFDLTGTKALFCRFGLMVNNASAPIHAGSGQARLSLAFRPVVASTVRAPMRKVHTGPDSQDPIFNPMTEFIAADKIAELRATWELAASTGDLYVQPAYQLTNHPEDWNAWETPVAFGTAATTEGVVFGEDFETVSIAAKYIRFGLNCDLTGSGMKACRASLRVDARN